MGIIGDIFLHALAEKAAYTAAGVALVHANKSSKIEGWSEGETQRTKVAIRQKNRWGAREFDVTDDNGRKLYWIDENASPKHCTAIKLFESEDSKVPLAHVKSVSLAIGDQFKTPGVMNKMKIFWGKKELDTIIDYGSLHCKMKCLESKWTLKGNITRTNVSVYDENGKEIINIHQILGGSKIEYEVKYLNSEHEMIAILFMMVVELSLLGTEENSFF